MISSLRSKIGSARPVIRRHWVEFAVLVLAPLLAVAGAVRLIAHTNWMTYDHFNVRTWPAVIGRPSGTFVLHGLLFCSLCLVFLNTIAYLLAGGKKKEVTVLAIYGLALAVVVVWGIEVYLGLISASLEGRNLDIFRHLHDLFACALFFLFALMDWMLYRQSKTARLSGASPRPNAHDRVEEETYLLQLLMVDLPVICGITFVNIFLHELLERSPALGTAASAVGFLTGFGAGSLVMQIAMSQFVFLVIYLRFFRETYRTKLGGAPAAPKLGTA